MFLFFRQTAVTVSRTDVVRLLQIDPSQNVKKGGEKKTKKGRNSTIFHLGSDFKGVWPLKACRFAHTRIIDDCCPQVTINDRGVCVSVT